MNVLPPTRVRREYVQKLDAPPDEVFPMLCPVREVEWTANWEPLDVYTHSGVVEDECVWTTREGGDEAVWIVTRHDPEDWVLEMVKVTPGVTAARIRFALSEREGGGTAARVVYSHTALGERGREFVAAFTAERFAELLRTWQEELNHYLSYRAPDETEPRYE